MIVGIGVDITEVERVDQAITRYGERILHRVFTEREIAYSNSKMQPYQKLAARFAAKEATFKALGTGLTTWKDVEIVNDPSGKPTLNLSGKAAEHAQSLGVTRTFVSLSDTPRYAAATVVLEG